MPQHFYRIEFRHFDEAKLRATGSRDTLRYEDAVVRLFEVRIAPGQSSRPARTRYPAILAIDTQRAFDALDAVVGPAAGRSLPPSGLALPRCITLDAGARWRSAIRGAPRSITIGSSSSGSRAPR